ncbi:MAG: NADH-quinone oxidoreductase subunit NuoE [Pseudomonadota bacterium]|nr:NADH-quinone oxidoreductase subunit NuoE [Pseudomonadota bacterium]
MLRRLDKKQPLIFKFSPKNLAWAKKQLKNYPRERKQSAVIPLLFRAQEQEGWVSKPAIEAIAKMLDMAPIRVFEVASFYFMFHLSPVGSTARIQVCGTTPCMLRGSEALIQQCKNKISKKPMEIAHNGKISWEEVECLGACSNAPLVQIGSDYYEDLDEGTFSELITNLISGVAPMPGSQKNRFASEPIENLTTLKAKAVEKKNASVSLFIRNSIKKKSSKARKVLSSKKDTANA